MIKEMDFDFNIISISITPFGSKPKNQIQEKQENAWNKNGFTRHHPFNRGRI
ncbi:hypothetical protein [Photorhabdus sp. RM323S]|uniref:hypothetical protein n=1 Tax=Photorhabdus sp. RM323S TaxID=3342828 RepID=UPI0036DB29E7